MSNASTTAFIDAMRAAIATYIRTELAKHTAKDTSTLNWSDLLITYGNWRSRFIPVRPRRAHLSDELVPGRHSQHTLDRVRAVAEEITAGADLTPRLSSRVTTPLLSAGERRKTALLHRADLDLLLSDWGVHHLHLGASLQADGTSVRTAEVLLVYFDPDDAYMIDVKPHPKHSNWASASIIESLVRSFPQLAERWRFHSAIGLAEQFSDDERLGLRHAGVTVLHEVDGAVYSPGGLGLSLAGTSLAEADHANGVAVCINRLAQTLEDDPFYFDRQVDPTGVHHWAWEAAVYEGYFGAMDSTGQQFVQVGALTRHTGSLVSPCRGEAGAQQSEPLASVRT